MGQLSILFPILVVLCQATLHSSILRLLMTISDVIVCFKIQEIGQRTLNHMRSRIAFLQTTALRNVKTNVSDAILSTLRTISHRACLCFRHSSARNGFWLHDNILRHNDGERIDQKLVVIKNTKRNAMQRSVTNCDHDAYQISGIGVFCTQKQTYGGGRHGDTSRRQEVTTNPQIDVNGNSQISYNRH